MRVLITGPGRGGTNWVTEILRCSPHFAFTKEVEDRQLFRRGSMRAAYGTKLATEAIGFTAKNVGKLMDKYDDLHLIFCFRHPVALCMSKIVRGQPASKGGDKIEGLEILAPDATVDGAIDAVQYAYDLSCTLGEKYPGRVLRIRLEDLISEKKRQRRIGKLCSFLRIAPLPPMMDAYKNTRNPFHQRRYGGKVDSSQAAVHLNWQTAYGGFFSNRWEDIKTIREMTGDIARNLGYPE